jgi:hypothetical protein
VPELNRIARVVFPRGASRQTMVTGGHPAGFGSDRRPCRSIQILSADKPPAIGKSRGRETSLAKTPRVMRFTSGAASY